MNDHKSKKSWPENKIKLNDVQASDKSAQQFDMSKNCTTTIPYTLDQRIIMARNAPKVFYGLQGIYKYSPLGEALINWAHANKISFNQQKDIKPGGLYHIGQKLITANANNSLALNVPILAHELMHAVQDECHQSLNYQLCWDLRTRISHTHSYEAAANVCSLQVAHEAKTNGFTAPWRALTEDRINGNLTHFSFLSQRYERAFDHAIEQRQPLKTAYKLAGTWGYIHYFRSSQNLEYYAKRTLTAYFNDLASNRLNTHIRNNFNTHSARKHGLLNATEKLTSVIKIAISDEEIFGQNRRLAQAADYLEFQRQIKLQDLKRGDYGYRRMLQKLRRKKNPFAEIKFSDLIRIQKQYPELDTYDVMEKMVKVTNFKFKPAPKLK